MHMAEAEKVVGDKEIAVAEQLSVPAVTLNRDFANIFQCVTDSRNPSNDAWDEF